MPMTLDQHDPSAAVLKALHEKIDGIRAQVNVLHEKVDELRKIRRSTREAEG